MLSSESPAGRKNKKKRLSKKQMIARIANLEAENEVQVVSQAGRQLQVVQLLVEEGDEALRGQVLLRLQNDEQRTAVARVEGQLRGVQRMIREEADCERVVQQLAAARGGLHRAFCDLIACAFEAKLDLGPDAPHPVREKLADLSELLKKYA